MSGPHDPFTADALAAVGVVQRRLDRAAAGELRIAGPDAARDYGTLMHAGDMLQRVPAGADGASVLAEAADLVHTVRRHLVRSTVGKALSRAEATEDARRLRHVAGLLDRLAIAARGASL